MLLHLASLLEGQRTGLLENRRGQSNLPDVVDKPCQMRLRLLVDGETESGRNVPSIDRNSRGMTSCVFIASVERCDQRGSEREIRRAKTLVCGFKFFRCRLLLTIEQ